MGLAVEPRRHLATLVRLPVLLRDAQEFLLDLICVASAAATWCACIEGAIAGARPRGETCALAADCCWLSDCCCCCCGCGCGALRNGKRAETAAAMAAAMAAAVAEEAAEAAGMAMASAMAAETAAAAAAAAARASVRARDRAPAITRWNSLWISKSFLEL